MPINNLFVLAVLFLGFTTSGYAQKGFKAKPILVESKTISGQPIVYPDTQSPQVTSVMVEIEPGGESGRHRHPVSPQIFVLEGKVTIQFDDGSSQPFAAGEAFMEAVDTWHNAKNLGTTPVKMLVVFFGEKGKKNLIRPGISGARPK